MAAYHPSSNGLTERAVRTVKGALSHRRRDTPMSDYLASFLLNYRITVHPTTGYTPSELWMGRKLRTRLDLLYPNVGRYAQMQQEKQKEAHDKSAKERPEFNTGSAVYARDFSQRVQKWETGTVVEQTGPVS